MTGAKKHIVIDPEVFDRLCELAAPGETANTVLRRALKMKVREQGRRSSVLKPIEEVAA